MGLFDLLKRAAGSKTDETSLRTVCKADGVAIEFATKLPEPTIEALLDSLDNAGANDEIFGALIAQLVDEGRCRLERSSAIVPWEKVYELFASPEQGDVALFLGLPPIGRLRPILGSVGTLSEPNFELEVVGWTDGERKLDLEALNGAVAIVEKRPELLPAAAWSTTAEIAQFRKRDASKRTQHENELAWGRIRQLADAAGTLYATPYLETTYVLTPHSLRLPLHKEETPFGRVMTVIPTFEGAPDGWLKAFDGFNSVQPHYDLTKGRGRVRVVISDSVRKVLEVIKHDMPGRKIAGSRAEKFVHNPWAFLGESAHEVIREDEFQADRAEAGSVVTNFRVVPRCEAARINSVDLLITECFSDGSAQCDTRSLSRTELGDFVVALEAALQEDRERFPWEEYDLTIDAEAQIKLEQSRQLLHLWNQQPNERISLEDIYELDGYSGRIEGIGVAKPIYVPVLQKPSADGEKKEGWLPSDLTPMVRVTLQGQGGEVLVPLTQQWVEDFEKQTSEAERAGKQEISNASLPTPVSTSQARTLVDSFHSMLSAQERVRGDGQTKLKEKKGPRETLLVKTNFHDVDYLEERRISLALPSDKPTELPRSLRASVQIKRHQLHGIAWFQHLVSNPSQCRGALLADDMGLGKTLQLLCLLGWYYERHPNAAPSVIFAPKTLLENWANEARKFFTPSFPKLLLLHGEELRALRQPVSLIDEQLRQKQIIDLLKPNWAGDAKIVISTYEVLTSYEFSLAKQPFAILICDEAQRIKSPGALVTLAAKKLKADFRIACTGTPVENSLADLWCLFDFVQPGLLGALEEFGKTHRRPIECETDGHKQALERLQSAISPQTLRRTKADISAELPKKYFVVKAVSEESIRLKERLSLQDRLEIRLTEHQRILYKGGLKKLQEASKESDGRKRARLSFGALHLMKAVCAEPYCLPGTKFLVDKGGREAHLANSPKLRWILDQLEKIRQAGEKAIIFTELREAQLALYHFLRESFGIKPFIINGDSQNRQAYIDKFSNREGFDVIILSTLAAGAGLNVTAANHVFHFTRAWNPAKESQATDRAYRIGQKRDVFVYCPTVVADDFATFEVRLDELLKKKAGLADSTLDTNTMVSMLNGTGRDATFSELVGSGGEGEEVPRRYLTMDDVDRMDGFSFEVLCCLLWTRRGFQAHVTGKRGGDGGIDVVALQAREGELLQCKSSINGQIGWDAIKEVTAGAARYQAQFSKTRFRKLAVTNQLFTPAAVVQAEANQVRLVTREQLEEFLGSQPITNQELDEALVGWESVLERVA